MKFCKTIYSWQAPEVEKVVANLFSSVPLALYHDNYLGKQEGHEKIFFEAYKKWTSSVLSVNWDDFSHSYATAGSSEAIREVVYSLKVKKQRLNVFKGEYEGYKAFAHAAEVEVIEHNREEWHNIEWKAGDVLFLSQPSSLDGNLWSDYDLFMAKLASTNSPLEVMLDLCYVGTLSKEYVINIDYPNVAVLFISLSKVFGVYYHRIGGMFSKKPYLGLFGNQWFKNMFSLELGTQLLTKFEVRELPMKYKDLQKRSIVELNKKNGELFETSDVYILANSKKVVSNFQRENWSRVCLTPFFCEEIKK